MNKREAKRLADEDTTPYGVYGAGRSGVPALYLVTGYRNAKIVAKSLSPVLILTEGEIDRIREGWRPL